MSELKNWNKELEDDVVIALNNPNNDTPHRKEKKSRKKFVWDAFSDFCGHTSIHGTQYLGEPGRHWLERLVWLVFIVSSMAVCSKFIHNLWVKWDETPVIVSFSERSTPIWNIPFPAITICPQVKTEKATFDFTDFRNKLKAGKVNTSDENFKYFSTLGFVCDADATRGLDLSSDESYDIINTFKELSPKKEDFLVSIKTMGLEMEMETIKRVVTDSGICFTFNGIAHNELYQHETRLDLDEEYNNKSSWTLENGYNLTEDNILELYPFHVSNAGINQGIDIVISGFDHDNDYLCRGPVVGFNVLIHSPDELPQVSQQNFRVPFEKEIVVSVDPAMITTSPALRHYHPERRQCYFNSEYKLKYFKYYTENNCKVECLAVYTQMMCDDCVPFWIPVSNDTRICNSTEMECMTAAKHIMNIVEYLDAASAPETGHEPIGCNCLPACTSISYTTDISQADYDFRTYAEYLEEAKVLLKDGARYARLKVGFRENQFISSKRSELYGTSDFIANCGGLLGLFMGISALSFVEIIYFCSFRLIANKKLIKRPVEQ